MISRQIASTFMYLHAKYCIFFSTLLCSVSTWCWPIMTLMNLRPGTFLLIKMIMTKYLTLCHLLYYFSIVLTNKRNDEIQDDFKANMREIPKIKCIMLILHDSLIKYDSINYTKQPVDNFQNSDMILFTLNTSSGYWRWSFTYLAITSNPNCLRTVSNLAIYCAENCLSWSWLQV